MLLEGLVEVRGQVMKTSAKGNSYIVVGLEQGIETTNMITKVDMTHLKGQTVKAQFDYNVAYKQFSLISYDELV